jgi:methylenetetrahydrofolate dehydrogenase (NADP+) / methenyltetrahydrofolate cyclohydrolase
MSSLLDGAELARNLRRQLATRVARLAHPPGLAVVLIGSDAASKVYVRNKIRACEEVGVHCRLVELPETISESDLEQEIVQLNAQRNIHGILVQLPMPKHLAAQKIVDTVAPSKDVDGLHSHNLGALFAGHPEVVPCTPAAVMELIAASGLDPCGRHAVVVGRGMVGKPTAILLLQKRATVTICNSKTLDLGAITRQADILVVAVGRPKLVSGAMVKAGAVVIDVGINRMPDGRIVGDVDFADVSRVASHISPVPGGVGPMTVAMVVANTVAAAERSMQTA